MKVGVLLVLSSPSANRLKARTSAGWSLDIMTEVLGESSIVVTGSPLVLVEVSPASAESRVWQGGMMIQGGQFKYDVKCWDSNSMGDEGDVKEGWESTPMGSFDVGQGGHQCWTW